MKQAIFELFFLLGPLHVLPTLIILLWPPPTLNANDAEPLFGALLSMLTVNAFFYFWDVASTTSIKTNWIVEQFLMHNVAATVSSAAALLLLCEGTTKTKIDSFLDHVGLMLYIFIGTFLRKTGSDPQEDEPLFFHRPLPPGPYPKTQYLVTFGPFAFVRNPSMFCLLATLVVRAVVSGSRCLAVYTICFSGISTLWLKYFEEPDLEHRFGQKYIMYCKKVPRWIPRLSPYRCDQEHRPISNAIEVI